MSIAYSYVRWSSDKQTSGDSLRRQTQAAIDYAAKHRLTLADTTYKDAACSAYTGKNREVGALAMFIEAVDKGFIKRGDILLIESLDRLSRAPVGTALRLFQDIVERGIEIITLMDGQRYSTASINANWTQLIVALAVMAKANSESAEKGKRVKEAWDDKRKAGTILTAMGPSWLKLNEKRKWELVPEKVAAVRRIFKLAETHGSLKIARTLVEEGVPTLGTAKKWDPALVLHVLRNSAVTGLYTPKKAKADPIPDYYPAIIKPKVFEETQARIATRKGSGGPIGETVSNLFTGLLRCECGAPMKYVSSNKTNLYVQCSVAYTSKSTCDAPTMPYNTIERELVRWVLEAADIPVEAEQVHDERSDLDDGIAKRQALLDAMVVALGDRSAAELPTLMNRMAILEAEKAELVKQRKAVIAPSPISDAHQRVKTLGPKFLKTVKPSEMFAVRSHMRAEFKLLLTKVTLLKGTHSHIDDLIADADGDQDLIDSYEEARATDDHQYREMLLEGPFVHAFMKAWPATERTSKYAKDTALRLDYMLPKWGFGRKRAS